MWCRRRMYYVGDDEGMIYRLYHSFYFSSKISCGSQHNAFEMIDKEIPICKIRNMYNPYHEMDISSAILKLREMSQVSRA